MLYLPFFSRVGATQEMLSSWRVGERVEVVCQPSQKKSDAYGIVVAIRDEPVDDERSCAA